MIPTKVICLTLNFLSPALLKDRYKKVEPINKIILPKKNVYKVYETPPKYFNIKINDKMKVSE